MKPRPPPRLLHLCPKAGPQAAAPAPPPCSSRRGLATYPTAGSKRPRAYTTTTTSSSSGGGTPNLASLAGEIKRLAFPHLPPDPAAASQTQHHYQHHPAFFPTPVFPLRSQDLSFLGEPAEFYETILERIRGATSRVTLSALYLGTGDLERRLVQELTDACRRRPGLRVRILLDHSRARRGGPGRDSLSTLAPLLQSFPGQAEVSLFRMPQLSSPWGRHIPSPLNEVVAVSHLKALAFDDALLLTGANLSHDYFTQRQDRYVAIQNAGALAAFYHELVALLSRFANTHPPPSSPYPPPPDPARAYSEPQQYYDAGEPNADGPVDPFHTLARELRRLWGQPPYSSFPEAVAAADTLALPTLQCAPLGIRHEEHILLALLRAHPALMATAAAAGGGEWAPPVEGGGLGLTLATAYLNPPPPLLEALSGWPGALSLVAPAAEAHGFAGATGLKAWIPLAYLMHEHAMHAQLSAERRQRHRKAVHGGVHMFRYARPGWTFHGKGLWMLPSPKGMRAAEAPLSLTVAGSSNYGFRSFERDLESQVLLLSRSPALARRLFQERQALLRYCDKPSMLEAAAPELEAALGGPWRRVWLPRLVEWTRDYL